MIKTLLIFLFPFLLSAQVETHMLDIPDPGKGLFDGINYQWTKQKSLALGILVISSIADGMVEGYEFGGRKYFETNHGVGKYSWSGSLSYLRAYKNFDPNQGYANLWSKYMGAWDFYHFMDDLRKFGYISAGIIIVIGAKSQGWREHLIDAAIYSASASISKSVAINIMKK